MASMSVDLIEQQLCPLCFSRAAVHSLKHGAGSYVVCPICSGDYLLVGIERYQLEGAPADMRFALTSMVEATPDGSILMIWCKHDARGKIQMAFIPRRGAAAAPVH